MLGQVIATEFLKLRRSKVTWFSLVAISLGPLGIALFMWIVREPGRAAQLGLLGTKADLSGISATWPSYFSMLTLVVGMGGMLLLSFIVAYVFGREYAEGTAKNLLALPVRRPLFVLAKFVVAAAWWIALVATVLIEALVIGRALGLPGFSTGLAAGAVRDALLAAGIAFLLVPVVAWITTLGQGYMPPLRLRARDAGARQRVCEDRLGRVVPVVDRAAAHRHGRPTGADTAPRQLRRAGDHVHRGHRGHDLAVRPRRQPPVERKRGDLSATEEIERSDWFWRMST